MTSKEAFDKVKGFILELRDTKYIEYKKYTDILNDLVERDTPMKPIVFNYEEHRLNHIECQNGCKPFKDKEYKFCPYCGQRLMWSKDNL